MSPLNSFIKTVVGHITDVKLPAVDGLKKTVKSWLGIKVAPKETSSISQSDQQMKALQRTLLGKDPVAQSEKPSLADKKVTKDHKIQKKLESVLKQVKNVFHKKEVKPEGRAIS